MHRVPRRKLFFELGDLLVPLHHLLARRRRLGRLPRQVVGGAHEFALLLLECLPERVDLPVPLRERCDKVGDAVVALRNGLLRGGEREFALRDLSLGLGERHLPAADLRLLRGDGVLQRADARVRRPPVVLEEPCFAGERAGLH